MCQPRSHSAKITPPGVTLYPFQLLSCALRDLPIYLPCHKLGNFNVERGAEARGQRNYQTPSHPIHYALVSTYTTCSSPVLACYIYPSKLPRPSQQFCSGTDFLIELHVSRVADAYLGTQQIEKHDKKLASTNCTVGGR